MTINISYTILKGYNFIFMKKLHILILACVSVVSASNSFDAIMTDVTHYDKKATSLSLKDARLSFDVPAISYMAVRPNYLLLGALKYIPKQHIGTTALGNTPIELEQSGWKYEIGAGYKFYISDNLYIAPALLFSDYYSTLYQTVGSTVIESNSHDQDVRLYGLIGYKLTKSTMMFIALELDNDILSDSYSNDYSQYSLSATVYQFFSKEWFAYIKYEQTLRDKEARSDSNGNINSIAYGFGIGVKLSWD